MKKIEHKKIAKIYKFLFVFNFFPIVAEPLAIYSASLKELLSIWSALSLSYIVMMTIIDIKILSRPIEIDRETKTGKLLLLFKEKTIDPVLDFTKIKAALDLLKQSIVVQKIEKLKKTLITLGYIGIIFFVIIPGCGRIGNGIYAKNKENKSNIV